MILLISLSWPTPYAKSLYGPLPVPCYPDNGPALAHLAYNGLPYETLMPAVAELLRKMLILACGINVQISLMSSSWPAEA